MDQVQFLIAMLGVSMLLGIMLMLTNQSTRNQLLKLQREKFLREYPDNLELGKAYGMVLHLYENEGPDTVIAWSPEDAVKVWEETTGQEFIDEECGGEFYQVADSHEFTLFEEELKVPDPAPKGGQIIEKNADGSTKTKATARTWAEARGRCFLGSTEY